LNAHNSHGLTHGGGNIVCGSIGGGFDPTGTTGGSVSAAWNDNPGSGGGVGLLFNNAHRNDNIARYDQTGTDGTRYISPSEVHFLVSINFTGGTIQCYANDALLPLYSGSETWSHVVAANNSDLHWYFNAPAGESADLWAVPQAIDLSVVATRRQFINADLSAVALPSNGSVTVAGSTVTPILFLHVLSSGAPGDFVINSGTGPNWTVTTGTLALSAPYTSGATGPCMAVIAGSPPPALPPGNLRCGTATQTSITPTWDAVAGATSYTLQYRVSGTTTWTTISGIAATSQLITGLAAGTYYEWQVATSISAFSASFLCRTAAAPGTVPQLSLLRQPLLHFIGPPA
jgi:hypothetical protein